MFAWRKIPPKCHFPCTFRGLFPFSLAKPLSSKPYFIGFSLCLASSYSCCFAHILLVFFIIFLFLFFLVFLSCLFSFPFSSFIFSLTLVLCQSLLEPFLGLGRSLILLLALSFGCSFCLLLALLLLVVLLKPSLCFWLLLISVFDV